MNEWTDCVVAGHICLDITPRMTREVQTAGEIFRPGKLIDIGPATISTGGPVPNTGFALRRLGMKINLMGKCGDDTFGRALIEAIRAEAPDAEAGMHIVSGEDTSYTVVVSPPGVDRMFMHCPGANDTFTAADVDAETVGRTKLFHFGYPPVMARTYAEGGAELEKIFTAAKAAGATTSLDMTYPDPAGPAGQVDWEEILQQVLPYVDIFTPSVEEIMFMINREKLDELLARATNGDILEVIDGELLSDLAGRCTEAGAGVVLIKCGYLGLYMRTAGPERLEEFGRVKCPDLENWSDRELFEPSYVVEKVVSATGAGDCAIAGFLAGLIQGCGVEEVLRYACAVAAQNLAAPDATSGIADWALTTALIQSNPPKIVPSISLDGWRADECGGYYVGPNDRQG